MLTGWTGASEEEGDPPNESKITHTHVTHTRSEEKNVQFPGEHGTHKKEGDATTRITSSTTTGPQQLKRITQINREETQ